MKIACIALSLAMLLTTLNAGAEVYRWTDKNGKANYSDLPPPDADAQARRLYDSKIDQDKLPFETKQAAERFPITLYVNEGCKEHCVTAREWLQKRKAPFNEKMIKTTEDSDAFKQLSGKKEIFLPSVTVGRKFIEGFEPGSWGTALDTAGYPK